MGDVEDFYKGKHNGRKLYWHHIMSNGVVGPHSLQLFPGDLLLSFCQIVFQNAVGKYELEVTTFQMAVLYVWNQRPDDKISYESLRCSPTH